MSYLIDLITKEGEGELYLNGFPLQVSIPYKLAKDLPLKCRCGFFLKVNYKLTDLYCPNPYCFESNAYKVVKIFEKAHVSLDIGQKTAERILLHNSFSRHMDIFTINSINQLPDTFSTHVREKWLNGLLNLRRNVNFNSFIEYFQLDNIGGTKCSFLFSGMSGIGDLEQALNSGYEFRRHISKVLGYASEGSNSTLKVYEAIKTNLPLFKLYAPYFTFKQVESKTLFIALTGNFIEFRPRTRFLTWLEENYKINPVLVKYSSKADVLVYEEASGSRQFTEATRDRKAVHLDDFLKKIEHLRREKNE